MGTLLESGEQVTMRISAQLLHGHDMTEPSYDAPEGYRPIPVYRGELILTDKQLLFVEQQGESPSWLSIPYGAIARVRPSQTQLLNYLVVWDADGHPDSFIVGRGDVSALHREVGQALAKRPPGSHASTRHFVSSDK